MKYRIICIDDPFENEIHFESLSALLYCIGDWFGDGDGYGSVREFNRERKGIHSAQVKKNGRWVGIPCRKKGKTK